MLFQASPLKANVEGLITTYHTSSSSTLIFQFLASRNEMELIVFLSLLLKVSDYWAPVRIFTAPSTVFIILISHFLPYRPLASGLLSQATLEIHLTEILWCSLAFFLFLIQHWRNVLSWNISRCHSHMEKLAFKSSPDEMEVAIDLFFRFVMFIQV